MDGRRRSTYVRIAHVWAEHVSSRGMLYNTCRNHTNTLAYVGFVAGFQLKDSRSLGGGGGGGGGGGACS